MTTSGPYTMATLYYEQPYPPPVGIVPRQDTLLYALTLYFPTFTRLVEIAGLIKKYDSESEVHSREGCLTVFVTSNIRWPRLTTKNEAYEYCLACTVDGRLSKRDLASTSEMKLTTLSDRNELFVESYYLETNRDADVFVNGCKVIREYVTNNGNVIVLNNEPLP